jgi:peptidyl-dipeptidase A
MTTSLLRSFAALAIAALSATTPAKALAQTAASATPGAPAPTAAQAKQFVDDAEQRLLELWIDFQRTSWVAATFITDDSAIISAKAEAQLLAATADYAKRATRFGTAAVDPATARKIDLLRKSASLAAPADPAQAGELTRLVTQMENMYSKGRHCAQADRCLTLQDITRAMAVSRDPAELLDVWSGWHRVARPMRGNYERFVELANRGARELGFVDTGAMWRSWYDMPPAEFAAEVDRLWVQVRPLYVSLHAYVRGKLRERYGDVVPADGPIPAHLLGNLWAQNWENIYPLVAPERADPGYDLTQILKSRQTEPIQMVKFAESFFTSIGFDPLPKTFWERSMFSQPRDRDVVCHANARNVDMAVDVRIRMCMDITSIDFAVVHHELGHNYYDLAYSHQPLLFRSGANDGFDEAVGDLIALSITPEYLVKIGLIAEAPDASRDIGLLLQRALARVAFLPFGLLVDQWRWKVFAGEVTPAHYNDAWWGLRMKYQGVAPPLERGEGEFDPGAKFHIPANVPYMRYFLSFILQFQFHRALVQAAGCTAPLHRCSIHGNAAAGGKLRAMLAMGRSRPWPDALEALTGQRRLDASALLEYFAPLQGWLDERNAGRPVGWRTPAGAAE